ncbi:MAG: hypothetical protein EA428_00200 [Spirochaetaceae bacterium]|nr:MAG: hypothetical protein EA428_00200 [Spirochaetaceae bacterium]
MKFISVRDLRSSPERTREALVTQAVQRMQSAAREAGLTEMDDTAIAAEIRAARDGRPGPSTSGECVLRV